MIMEVKVDKETLHNGIISALFTVGIINTFTTIYKAISQQQLIRSNFNSSNTNAMRKEEKD